MVQVYGSHFVCSFYPSMGTCQLHPLAVMSDTVVTWVHISWICTQRWDPGHVVLQCLAILRNRSVLRGGCTILHSTSRAQFQKLHILIDTCPSLCVC